MFEIFATNPGNLSVFSIVGSQSLRLFLHTQTMCQCWNFRCFDFGIIDSAGLQHLRVHSS